MNSNAEFEALAREPAIPAASSPQGRRSAGSRDLLVVRLVRGLSRNRWQEFCRSFPSSQWCALPLSESHEFVQVADLRPDIQEPLPPDLPSDSLAKALALELFTAQLNREILRLARSGGELTLVCAALCERKRLLAALGEGTVKRLDSLLAETLHEGLEACDSLGSLGPGRHALLLPGVGLFKARLLAENLQTAFAAQARPLIPQGGISAGEGPVCALGITCLPHDTAIGAQDLLGKADEALTAALEQQGVHIHLETHAALNERATLVHSSEKRFLFYGGE